MKDLFCKNLKRLRKQKEMSQEQLAQALGITVQAVSKWECALSYPDIETLLLLSDFLDVTVDELLRDSAPPVSHKLLELPDDNTLRVIQCIGNRIIQKDDLCPSSPVHTLIPLTLKDISTHTPIHIEIWGSAEIDGNIEGDVNAGNSITCGNINNNAHAGDSLTCDNIGNDAHAGDSITCGNIANNAHAGDSIVCGDIDGNAQAGDNITCADIDGSVTAGKNIACNDIQGDVCSCGGDIHCTSINGSANAEGGIYLQNS